MLLVSGTPVCSSELKLYGSQLGDPKMVCACSAFWATYTINLIILCQWKRYWAGLSLNLTDCTCARPVGQQSTGSLSVFSPVLLSSCLKTETRKVRQEDFLMVQVYQSCIYLTVFPFRPVTSASLFCVRVFNYSKQSSFVWFSSF